MIQRPDRPTRRAVLGGCGGLVATFAGCSGASGATVLAAGSLAAGFEDRVGPAFTETTEYAYGGEYRGSNALLRMVCEKQRRPDAIVSADAQLLRDRLRPELADWDVVVATNEVVIAADPSTAVGQRLLDGEYWPDVLRSSEATVARTDPDLDPLGYRALHLFELAERFYDEPGLADALEVATTVTPGEASLLAGVETGEYDAAIAYRNMAVDRDLGVRSLPPALNFADIARAEQYAEVSYTTSDGHTVHGRPVRYAATVPETAPDPAAGRAFVRFLADRADLLDAVGLTTGDGVPVYSGAVPREVRA
ncbi:extracellular solute-binding protein [Halococcoides cellulosivorans]|uniref:Sulfate ABC transporter substrate-binding protein n=1 Tax=Halococcoides cellulosivorans TaxID=1679096 RepID=A0A2R4X0S3_9EURY|nr:extracellular solute-binding protein [Halococcoides cellulosivorans]AWB27399.1 sulfate ABC transporter substrate-binding protein [Halococcoides cellulosivorans]